MDAIIPGILKKLSEVDVLGSWEGATGGNVPVLRFWVLRWKCTCCVSSWKKKEAWQNKNKYSLSSLQLEKAWLFHREAGVIPYMWLNQSCVMECFEIQGVWKRWKMGYGKKKTRMSLCVSRVLFLKIDKRKSSACARSRKRGVKAWDMAYIKTASCRTCTPNQSGMNINEGGNDPWEM